MNPAIKILRKLRKKATGGRWWYDDMTYIFSEDKNKGSQMVADKHVEEACEPVIRMRGVGANLPIADNARYIAEMHNELPAILNRLEKLEKFIVSYRHSLETLKIIGRSNK